MKIVDSNDFNVRTTALLLSKASLEFLIIPVLHFGSKEFYAAVQRELNKCDLILFEGIQLKGLAGLSEAYRFSANRLGLVYQGDEINMKKYGDKLIHADLDHETAEREWLKIPYFSRLAFQSMLLLAFPFISFFSTKTDLALAFREHNEEVDDELWPIDNGQSNTVGNFIKTKRDQAILEQIDLQVQLHTQKTKRIGVIYGAGHMKIVVNHLIQQHKFNVRDSWFLTVFWLTEHRFQYKSEEGNQK